MTNVSPDAVEHESIPHPATSQTQPLPAPHQKPKPLYKRTHGARKGRMEKPEELFHDLIRAGKVAIIRRKGAPPLIKWL